MNAFIMTKRESLYIQPYIPPEIRFSGNLVLGCMDDEGTCLGVTVLSVEGHNARLLYIYVAPAYRRRGAGSAMLDLVGEIARQNDLYGVEVNFFLEKDTEGLLHFFHAMDYTDDTDDIVPEITTTLSVLSSNMPRIQTQQQLKLYSLSETGGSMFRRSGYALLQHTASDAYIPLLPKDCYSSELSFLAFLEEEPQGGILVRMLSEEEFEVAYLWMLKKQPQILLALLNASLEAANKRLSPDTSVRMIGYTPEGMGLIRKLVGASAVERTPIRLLYAI